MVKQKIINKNNSLRYKFKVFTCVFLTGLFLKVPILQAATPAEIDAMRNDSLTWLINSQNTDGRWQGAEGSGIQTTSIVLDALKNSGDNSYEYARVYSRGLAWLANAEAYSVDSLSRQIVAMANAGMGIVHFIKFFTAQ